MRILYYDCFAGISGDMNLGAMIDLGVDPEYLKNELSGIPVHGYELKITRDIRRGITGTRVQVIIDEHHDHLQGDHHHGNENHHHHHNTFREIRQMITESKLDEQVKKLSIAIFARVAEAEAKIHGKSVDEVHFHEVGAIDSIVDIIGAAICLKSLSPDEIQCSTVELGGGTVRCAHGIYPVPAPATAEIIRDMPVRKGTVDYEATTPTGAAILAACVDKYSDKSGFKIVKTGYGIGSRDAELPNVLRVFLCETADEKDQETSTSTVIECNIDDMNPEFYDHIIDSLFEAGAKDVFITPVIMKKTRPAVKLSVLCESGVENKVKEILLCETSTLGLRKYSVERTMLERKTETINTKYGDIRVKTAYYEGARIKSKPEYDDCLKTARNTGIPVSQVYREVEIALSKNR